LGFADEVWWSRLAQPAVATWTSPQAPQEPLRLHTKQRAKGDQEAKALACYGVLLKHNATTAQNATAHNAGEKEDNGSQMLLRFVQGRPVSSVTCQFLQWVCQRLQEQGQRVLVLVWDNATWHLSRQVQQWISTYNQQAKRTGGLRLLVCRLPSKSPWLNAIEPKWRHGKQAVVEPQRVLSASELVERVCAYYGCEHLAHLEQ
jgi:hypothetical protein